MTPEQFAQLDALLSAGTVCVLFALGYIGGVQ